MVKNSWLLTILSFMALVFFLQASSNEKQLKRFVINNNGFGTYSFEYETSEGSFRKEEGGLLGNSGGSLVVRGEYGYIDPSGHRHAIKYIADVNGFQPQFGEDHVRYNDRRII